MPALARTVLIAALLPALPAPMQAAGLERGSPFYRAAPYMPPPAATFSAPAEAGRFRPAHVHEAPPVPPAGRLPNQRTGPMRDHVVRDICVGC